VHEIHFGTQNRDKVYRVLADAVHITRLHPDYTFEMRQRLRVARRKVLGYRAYWLWKSTADLDTLSVWCACYGPGTGLLQYWGCVH